MLLDSLPEAATTRRRVVRPSSEGHALRRRGEPPSSCSSRALAAGRTTTVWGKQAVLARMQDRLLGARVAIDTRSAPGHARQRPRPRRSSTLASSVAPDQVTADEGTSPVDLIAHAYALSTASGVAVAGQPATVVTATGEHGVVAKRWWVDDATGVLLWQESYDDDGELEHGGRLHRGRRRALRRRGPAARPPPASTTVGANADADAAELAGSGWSCADEMVGLDLLEVSTDTPTDPRSLHAVYGDGVSTVSVLQRHGRLSGVPAGARWDDALGAWRHDGAVRWATWQSGDTVYTVTTDGTAALLRRAVATFPHAGPVETTTLGRVREGWSRILADLKG